MTMIITYSKYNRHVLEVNKFNYKRLTTIIKTGKIGDQSAIQFEMSVQKKHTSL